jgi:hypothetical protein
VGERVDLVGDLQRREVPGDRSVIDEALTDMMRSVSPSFVVLHRGNFGAMKSRTPTKPAWLHDASGYT